MMEYSITNARKSFSLLMRQALKGVYTKIKRYGETYYIVDEDCYNTFLKAISFFELEEPQLLRYTSNVARDALCELCYEVEEGKILRLNRYNKHIYMMNQHNYDTYMSYKEFEEKQSKDAIEFLEQLSH